MSSSSSALVAVGRRCAFAQQDWKKLVKERDALIVACLEQGMSERDIARLAGVSHVRVHQISRRRQ